MFSGGARLDHRGSELVMLSRAVLVIGLYTLVAGVPTNYNGIYNGQDNVQCTDCGAGNGANNDDDHVGARPSNNNYIPSGLNLDWLFNPSYVQEPISKQPVLTALPQPVAQPVNPAQTHQEPVNPVQIRPEPVNPAQTHPEPVNPAQTRPEPVNPVQTHPEPVNPAPRSTEPVTDPQRYSPVRPVAVPSDQKSELAVAPSGTSLPPPPPPSSPSPPPQTPASGNQLQASTPTAAKRNEVTTLLLRAQPARPLPEKVNPTEANRRIGNTQIQGNHQGNYQMAGDRGNGHGNGVANIQCSSCGKGNGVNNDGATSDAKSAPEYGSAIFRRPMLMKWLWNSEVEPETPRPPPTLLPTAPATDATPSYNLRPLPPTHAAPPAKASTEAQTTAIVGISSQIQPVTTPPTPAQISAALPSHVFFSCKPYGAASASMLVPDSGCKYSISQVNPTKKEDLQMQSCADGTRFDLRICACNLDKLVDPNTCASVAA